MRSGVVFSVGLHAAAVALAFVSLPEFLRTRVVEAPVIPIELIDKADLGKLTSVPAAAPKPKPLPEKKPESPAATPPEPPKAEEEKEPEPKKEPPPAEAKKDPEKDPPKKDPPKKPDDLDLDALAALIDKSKKEPPPGGDAQAAEEAERAREAIGAGDRLTVTEIDKMRAAVARCWNVSATIGAPDPEKLVVVVDIDLNADGTLARAPRVANAVEISLSGNRFWKVAEQNAVRAVQTCAPYDFFDPSRYQDWKEFQIGFSPATMAGF